MTAVGTGGAGTGGHPRRAPRVPAAVSLRREITIGGEDQADTDLAGA
jgi:hypothetical protein